MRWFEEHVSNYPGCGLFYMLDLDKKVGNKVCANTKGGSDQIKLDNMQEKGKPYVVNIKTGCKNEPKKGERFCACCMSSFSVSSKKTDDVLFLESLHPHSKLSEGKQKSKCPGEG